MGNFLDKLNAKIQAFMANRNGADRISILALFIAVVTLIINMAVPNVIFSMVSYAALFYSIYRMFSKNRTAREEEESKFDEFIERIKPGDNKKKKDSGFTTRKSSKTSTGGPVASGKITIKCEECGQSLSVPRGRGKLKVTCPKCGHQQIVES